MGPALGGLLFSVKLSYFCSLPIFLFILYMIHFSRKIGGFGLPFYVIGIAVTLLAPMNFFLIPKLESKFEVFWLGKMR